MAEVLAVPILEEGKVGRPFLAQDAHKDAAHHGQGSGGKTVRALQGAVGVKAPVHVGCAVHEKEGLFVGGKVGWQGHGWAPSTPCFFCSKVGKKGKYALFAQFVPCRKNAWAF